MLQTLAATNCSKKNSLRFPSFVSGNIAKKNVKNNLFNLLSSDNTVHYDADTVPRGRGFMTRTICYLNKMNGCVAGTTKLEFNRAYTSVCNECTGEVVT